MPSIPVDSHYSKSILSLRADRASNSAETPVGNTFGGSCVCFAYARVLFLGFFFFYSSCLLAAKEEPTISVMTHV